MPRRFDDSCHESWHLPIEVAVNVSHHSVLCDTGVSEVSVKVASLLCRSFRDEVAEPFELVLR
jgi:hypothetical protein